MKYDILITIPQKWMNRAIYFCKFFPCFFFFSKHLKSIFTQKISYELHNKVRRKNLILFRSVAKFFFYNFQSELIFMILLKLRFWYIFLLTLFYNLSNFLPQIFMQVNTKGGDRLCYYRILKIKIFFHFQGIAHSNTGIMSQICYQIIL